MVDVSRETQARLQHFVKLLIAEGERQNLIARSTVDAVWNRHILDSLQLFDLAPHGLWLDIGTGGGLPGMVIAIVRPEPIVLVEPRALRAEFLERVAESLVLEHVTVLRAHAEALPPQAARVISARAVAPLPALLALSHRHAAKDCVWLLPKGRKAVEELAEARRSWQGDFRLVASRTDSEAAIVVIRDLEPRRSGGRPR